MGEVVLYALSIVRYTKSSSAIIIDISIRDAKIPQKILNNLTNYL